MSQHLDIKVLETLSSKICHDLISPVSAINNGVELIEDDTSAKSDFFKDAIRVVEFSGGQASKRLQLFRLAYGSGLSRNGANLKEITQTIENYFSNSKFELSYDKEIFDHEITSRTGFGKLYVNSIVLAYEVLQTEGEIAIKLSESKNKQITYLTLSVTGAHKEINKALLKATKGNLLPQDVNITLITAYMLGCYAKHYEADVEMLEKSPSQFELTLKFKNDY